MKVIQFKPKDQLEFESKLAELKKMFALIKQQQADTKCNWVLLTRDNFMKIIPGTMDAPRIYRIAKFKKISWRVSESTGDSVSDNEYLEFELAKQLDNGDLLYVEQ